MPHTKMTTTVAVAAGALALGVGLGAATLASADPTSTPAPSTSASPSAGSPTTAPEGPGRHGFGGRAADGQGELAKTLADKLGVSEDTLKGALKAVREDLRPSTPPPPGTDRPDRAARDAALAKGLAAELGIAESKVTAALAEIRAAANAERAAALKDKLDAAVKAGTLTQAEADAVTKAVEKGVLNGFPR